MTSQKFGIKTYTAMKNKYFPIYKKDHLKFQISKKRGHKI